MGATSFPRSGDAPGSGDVEDYGMVLSLSWC
jgi:hypothetical protein